MRRPRGALAGALIAVWLACTSGTAAADATVELTKLERRLLEAPRLCVRFRIESSGAVAAELEGRARFDREHAPTTLLAKGTIDDREVDLSLLAARGRLWLGRRGDSAPVPGALHEALVIGLTRMGLLHNVSLIDADRPPDHGAGGVQEWVGLEDVTGDGPYAFGILVAGRRAGAAVLDLDEHGLPSRRTQTIELPTGRIEVVERYHRFEPGCPSAPN